MANLPIEVYSCSALFLIISCVMQYAMLQVSGEGQQNYNHKKVIWIGVIKNLRERLAKGTLIRA